MTPRELLALPLPDNDSGANTVRGYFAVLLAELWREGEGFSGKRPFGNSSWEYDLYMPMVRAGAIEGVTADDDGEIADWNAWRRGGQSKADALILAAITLFAQPDAAQVADIEYSEARLPDDDPDSDPDA